MSSDDEQPKINKRPFRPQSTLVQNFSADLDSIFGMTPELDNLSQTIEQKQRTVSTAEQELQALQARLRATEQKLAKVSRGNSPNRAEDGTEQQPTTAGAGTSNSSNNTSTSPLSRRPMYPADRPPTGAGSQQQQQGPMRAQNGNGEYVMVDRNQQ